MYPWLGNYGHGNLSITVVDICDYFWCDKITSKFVTWFDN